MNPNERIAYGNTFFPLLFFVFKLSLLCKYCYRSCFYYYAFSPIRIPFLAWAAWDTAHLGFFLSSPSPALPPSCRLLWEWSLSLLTIIYFLFSSLLVTRHPHFYALLCFLFPGLKNDKRRHCKAEQGLETGGGVCSPQSGCLRKHLWTWNRFLSHEGYEVHLPPTHLIFILTLVDSVLFGLQKKLILISVCTTELVLYFLKCLWLKRWILWPFCW